MTTLYILGSVALVSFVSLAGLFALSLKPRWLMRMHTFLIPLAVGALLGDAFFHLIRESFEKTEDAVWISFLLVLGMVSFFILERFLRWHRHTATEMATTHEGLPKHLGRLILVSDGFHNFFDGIAIGASYLVGMEVGIATTLAIILHEIPQEITDFGILIYSGYERIKALFYNFLSALTAVAGAMLVVLYGSLPEPLLQGILPFTAGIFIYIAAADLVPELHRNENIKTVFIETAAIGLGLLAMYLLLFLE